MTRLAATLGTSGIAAALVLAAFQALPSRDGGTARAGTPTPALAWTDPPRTPPAPTVAVEAPVAAASVAPEARTAEVQAAASPIAQPHARHRRAARPEHERRLAARVRRTVAAQALAQRPDRAPETATVRIASARMGGPVGDILHGLGLD